MEFEKLQQIIAEVLNTEPDEITMNTTFVDDLGADSLDIFQIIMGNRKGNILRSLTSHRLDDNIHINILLCQCIK